MDRERQILERVLSLKQVIREERSGPVDLHELGICYFYLENYDRCLETLESLIDQYSNYVDIGRVQALRIYAMIQLERWEEARFVLMDRKDDPTSEESDSRRKRAEATAEGKESREERCYLRTSRMIDEWPREAK